MRKFLNKVRESLKSDYDDDISETEEYVELNDSGKVEDKRPQVVVKPYVLDDFSDVKLILDSLREGNTIAIVNIKPLKQKDMHELQRAIVKLKNTCSAINGEIAGFGDDYIAVVPGFATIEKGGVAKAEEDIEE